MQTPETQIRELLDEFTSNLMKIVRGAALDSLATALGAVERSGGGQRAAAPRLNGGAAKVGRPAAAAKTATATKSRRGRTGRKRDPKLLAALTKRVGEYIGSHSGQGVRQIGPALGVSTRELELPIKKLLSSKQIRKTGTRSETRYFARGEGGGAKK